MTSVHTTVPGDTLRRVVRQHAQTARLLGVDFVPSYRTSEDPDPAPEPPQTLAQTYIEAKPLAPAPARAPAPAPARAPLRASPPPSAPPRSVPVPSTPPTFTRAPRNTCEDDRAYKARLLTDLRARYEQDAPHQHFVTGHTNIVFGDGDPGAVLVFVGEAPGAEEDRTGIPFVGRSGELLNKMIGAMGLTRETVYICNVLKTRPPDNATPTDSEAAFCEPYLLEQLGIIAPQAIVTLGLPAARLLLRRQDSMTRMRGTWAKATVAGGVTIPVMPTFHPAYVLRCYTADVRNKVWSDLQLVMERLGLRGGKAPPA